MSKSNTLRTSTQSTSKNLESKTREASKDRSTVRKTVKLIENTNAVPARTKVNGSLKATEIPSSITKNGIKKSSKKELIKTDLKSKLKKESSRSVSTVSNKSSPSVVNKSPSTTSRTLSNTQSSSSTLLKSKRSTAPETPPSTRVTKTQYFPTKNLYSNAVKEQQKPETQRIAKTEFTASSTKTKVSDLSETKLKAKLKTNPSVTKTKEKSPRKKTLPQNLIAEITERPRTATLKRGSIVNSNIAGPDIPISETPSLTSLDLSYEQEVEEGKLDKEEAKPTNKVVQEKEKELKQEETYDYEDDFDSYESDFEEYRSSDSLSSSDDDNAISGEQANSSDNTSSVDDALKMTNTAGITDEERMLDSGNFDMPENKHKQLLGNIKESNEQDNFKIEIATENNRSNMASLSDEGFEDGKSSLQSGNMHFINFVDAQKKWKQNKHLEKRRKRGEEILNMIRLDHYNFTLVDMPPVSYNDYIKIYGKTNTIQISIQTGDDDTSEEIQTDMIDTGSKWTQFPITFSKIDSTNSNYMEIYKKEFMGVGNDSAITSESNTKHDFTNSIRLKRFLSRVGQTIVTLLEESSNNASEQIIQNQRKLPFSKGYIKFDTKSHMFLNNRPINSISYCSLTNIKIVTVHGRIKNADETTVEDLSLKSIVCIWSTLNSKQPEKILSVTGDLKVCCFASEMKNLVFGGLYDGSIVTWDISEDIQMNTDKAVCMQQPNFTTEINYGHSSTIVSIQPLRNTADNFLPSNFEWKSPKNQICSLDDNGTLIIWGVIQRNYSSLNNFNNHTAMPWAQVSFVQISKIFLKDLNPDLTDLLCTDMNINEMDSDHLFISTNYGYIIHCLVTQTKSNPRKFNPGIPIQANCVESCPFSPMYFFAGHDNGAIMLYSRLLERPLMVMSNKEDTLQSGIEIIQWSHHRPCVFYAKDHCNTIHIWDIAISDLYPIYSIPFKENISAMKLSPILMNNNDSSYMLLATESGSVDLHILNAEHGPSSLDSYQQDMNKFLNYVSRL